MRTPAGASPQRSSLSVSRLPQAQTSRLRRLLSKREQVRCRFRSFSRLLALISDLQSRKRMWDLPALIQRWLSAGQGRIVMGARELGFGNPLQRRKSHEG